VHAEADAMAHLLRKRRLGLRDRVAVRVERVDEGRVRRRERCQPPATASDVDDALAARGGQSLDGGRLRAGRITDVHGATLRLQ
jgi:hypothetical protein